MQVKSLHIYPIKSTRGIELMRAEVRPRGLVHDRRFMLVDSKGVFLTQRRFPKMAQIQTNIIQAGISICWPGQNWVNLPLTAAKTKTEITVWRDTFAVLSGFTMCDAPLSAWLEHPVSLVFMGKNAKRFSNAKWTAKPTPVSFADGYPILVTTTASLSAVNKHIVQMGGDLIGMERFRPNIVIKSEIPWAEDDWGTLEIGDITLDLVKPCARCIITSIDQTTGNINPKSVLAALRALHPSIDPKNPGVLFGWNAVARGHGNILVGQNVTSARL